jgi:hypothetical protein
LIAAKTVILAQVDPKAPLPSTLLNFIIRNIAGLLLYFFQQKVLAVSNDPNCSHNVRMIENKEFYIKYLENSPVGVKTHFLNKLNGQWIKELYNVGDLIKAFFFIHDYIFKYRKLKFILSK